MTIDYFGYLGKKESYDFVGGKITVVDDFEQGRNWIEKYTNRDGFLYPPTQNTYSSSPLTPDKKEIIPKTERPALLHSLPYSHSIEISNCGSIEEQRKGPSGFLIQLLGFLLGYRLQFHDWWVDGRVPIGGRKGLSDRKMTTEDFLSHCFPMWKKWNPADQKLITNILFMFSRSVHYEWSWERFAIGYMVIDGLWKLSCNLKVVSEHCPHKDRIQKMCEAYKIPINDLYIGKIVSLRNDLFHETIWDKGQPGSSGSSDTDRHVLFLRNLSTRIILGIFDYDTPFIKTEWWSFSSFIFEKKC